MNQSFINMEINQLLNRIAAQQEKLNLQQGNIPAIELDLQMKLILELYEHFDNLKKLNSFDEAFPGKSNIAGRERANVEAEDTSFLNLNDMEKGGLSEQINIMAAMEREEDVQLHTSQENKRAELFMVSQEIAVKEMKVDVDSTVMVKSVPPVKQNQKPMAELFDEPPTIAKSYSGKETLHDKMSGGKKEKSVAAHLQNKPLTDLKKSIGINERFVFIKVLFNGDQKLYNQSIEQLNNFSNFEEAGQMVESLVKQMNWKLESKEFTELNGLIRRRFNG